MSRISRSHIKMSEISKDLHTLNREKADVIRSNRAPVSTDTADVGTFWMDTVAVKTYQRYPEPDGWVVLN